ncbi:SPOR domain-containing protein [Paenibacillus ginsengarvi]|uniref:SPOR domain-containing protein n=1 Tax=Paenibacillus ginsengarvi TaxID=400777 RepID=A0A3B0CET1_9BACL|nr:SPOR domain-containing protein [Paenibacillus ginsengarvi]RKN83860.1 SPOR domain-containing protein [Paenibacillus ginsengarvi]
MNKARITYRFDETGRETVRKDQPQVIPLLKEEYSVVREDHWPGEEPVIERSSGNHREEPAPRPARGPLFDTQPLNQFTTDFGAWKSPFDEETERVERMIRESERQRTEHPAHPPASAQSRFPDRLDPERYPLEPEERYDGHTGYYEPERERSERSYVRGDLPPHLPPSRYERNSPTSWLKVIASVAGAVGTGVLIGFFVLSMFGGEETQKNGSDAAAGPGKSVAVAPSQTGTGALPGQTAAGGGKENAAPASTAASGATVPLNMAAATYTLLQNGVFTNQQGADSAVAELKKKGLAAYVQQSDKFYVYVGFAPNRDDALALSQLLKDQKMELFLKALPLPAVSKIKWAGEQPAAVETFFTQNQKLVQTIGGFAVAHLKEKTPSALDDATLQTIHTAHQAWSGASATFGSGLGADQKAALQKWVAAMNTAVTSMDEYKKNPSSAYLWQAQSSLMQVLFLENELLAAIQA